METRGVGFPGEHLLQIVAFTMGYIIVYHYFYNEICGNWVGFFLFTCTQEVDDNSHVHCYPKGIP